MKNNKFSGVCPGIGKGAAKMSMNKEIYTALREEHRRELMTEANELRRAREIYRQRPNLGRRAIGRLGSMMITVGARLERIEHGGGVIAYDIQD